MSERLIETLERNCDMRLAILGHTWPSLMDRIYSEAPYPPDMPRNQAARVRSWLRAKNPRLDNLCFMASSIGAYLHQLIDPVWDGSGLDSCTTNLMSRAISDIRRNARVRLSELGWNWETACYKFVWHYTGPGHPPSAGRVRTWLSRGNPRLNTIGTIARLVELAPHRLVDPDLYPVRRG